MGHCDKFRWTRILSLSLDNLDYYTEKIMKVCYSSGM